MPRGMARPMPRATAPAAPRGRPTARGRGESYSKSTPPKPKSRPDRHHRTHSPSHSPRKDRGRAKSTGGVKRPDEDDYDDIFKRSDDEPRDRDYGYDRTYSPPPRRDTHDRGRSRRRESPGYEYINGPLDHSPSPHSGRRGSDRDHGRGRRRHSSQPRERSDRPPLHSRKSRSAAPSSSSSRRDRMSDLKQFGSHRERQYPDSKDFGRSKSRGSKSRSKSRSGASNPKWLNCADAAIDAGLLAIYRHRREPGAWVGVKGARVASAALGAAALDAFIQREGERSGFRRSAEATVGGMLLSKMVGGQAKESKVFF